ncbi:MAG TPA: type II CAAX endopeptidase family protein [Candidatus Babeliales bacterium]|nr:type II CAAX endopeptidase family protein [Candidatus Babeliales bacterium]
MKAFSLRSPLLWATLVAATIGCIIFSALYFPRAIPLVALDIKIDRQQALESAKQIAHQHHLGPLDYHQAVEFKIDQLPKVYMEYDCGFQAYTKVLENHLYEPYTWQVRHFKEFDTHETTLIFTPQGTLYGFKEKLSEDAPGAQLSSEKARHLAETIATEQWHFSLENYALIETAQEKKPNGRIDHLFIYERSDQKIGDAHYRIRLTLSGDKLTEFTHLVKVPDEFVRRYTQIRSANDSLASVATIIMMVVYLLGGCVLGTLFLARRKAIIWWPAFWWALIIAVLHFAYTINDLPIEWMKYDTALPYNSFLFSYLLKKFSEGLTTFFTVLLVFIAAEGLTRLAFGNQIRFWSLWNPRVASSIPVLGRTILGYLMVASDIAISIAIYCIARSYFGWWNPSDTLIDPNILASYAPWLSSIAQSLQAGFQEECLFRAVPLAGAALIGQRFGNQRLWIVAAFIFQAFVFGAAHANYAAQPFYARLVELILPSFLFAAAYLAFGLLTSIIAHFIIDVFWIGLPLFMSHASGAWIDKGIVIILALFPLFIVLRARYKMGAWSEIHTNDLNKTWRPPAQEQEITQHNHVKQQHIPFTNRWLITGIIGGCTGLLLWVCFTRFTQEGNPLAISRNAAIECGYDTLKSRGINLDHTWTPLAAIYSSFDRVTEDQMQHRFIRQSGKKLYDSLLGSYLTPAHWIVRMVKFNGSVVERAQEYKIHIADNGTVLRIEHTLPETQEGAQLSEREAYSVAETALKSIYHSRVQDLKEIAAVPQKLPSRTDWSFTFVDPQYPLSKGQERVTVEIAGDEVVDINRTIHVPEQWERTERNIITQASIGSTACTLFMYLLLIILTFIVLTGISRQKLSIKTSFLVCSVITIFLLINTINLFADTIANFNTMQPYYNQLFKAIGTTIIQLILKIALFGSIAVLVTSWKTSTALPKSWATIITGLNCGLFVSGALALLYYFDPIIKPEWAQYAALGAYLPTLAVITIYTLKWILLTLALLLLFAAIDQLNFHGKEHAFSSSLLMLITGIILIGSYSTDSILFWLIAGSITGLVLLLIYYWIIRYDHSLIPLATGSYILTVLAQQGAFCAFPAIIPGAIMATVIIGSLSLGWFYLLNK